MTKISMVSESCLAKYFASIALVQSDYIIYTPLILDVSAELIKIRSSDLVFNIPNGMEYLRLRLKCPRTP